MINQIIKQLSAMEQKAVYERCAIPTKPGAEYDAETKRHIANALSTNVSLLEKHFYAQNTRKQI